MAHLTQTPDHSLQHPKKHRKRSKSSSKRNTNNNNSSNNNNNNNEKQPSSWDQIKNLLTCKQIEPSKIHDPSKPLTNSLNMNRSCSNICTFRDVVHGNTRVVHRADAETKLMINRKGTTSSGRSFESSGRSNGGDRGSYSRGGMQLRKLSGCYECQTIGVLDPTRYQSRTTICACSECGEVFPTIESMELHRAVRHAVYELHSDDSSRNIVEIIFKSSWLKKNNPICKIERILKVQNSPRTIQRFEDHRDTIKLRAKRNPRCAADGNELLRFHCATLACPLGARGSSTLCGPGPSCGVCTIIRHGFRSDGGDGVRTTASSGRAHDGLVLDRSNGGDRRRAMLVCRVIAGRVRRRDDDDDEDEKDESMTVGSYDSKVGTNNNNNINNNAGLYSSLEELWVFNPRAILPCFVVIYKALES